MVLWVDRPSWAQAAGDLGVRIDADGENARGGASGLQDPHIGGLEDVEATVSEREPSAGLPSTDPGQDSAISGSKNWRLAHHV